MDLILLERDNMHTIMRNQCLYYKESIFTTLTKPDNRSIVVGYNYSTELVEIECNNFHCAKLPISKRNGNEPNPNKFVLTCTEFVMGVPESGADVYICVECKKLLDIFVEKYRNKPISFNIKNEIIRLQMELHKHDSHQ